MANQAQFAQKLFGLLASAQENIIISPLSIYAGLSLAAAGAQGKTLDEIVEVFGLKGKSPESIHSTIASVLQSFAKAQESNVISIANNIYVDRSAHVLGGFVSMVSSLYNAEISTKDFLFKDPEASRNEINGWVEKNTQGMIKDLIGENFLTPETLLVLVNAIYFNAKWSSPFYPQNTLKDADFHVSQVKTTKVALMRKGGYEEYGENQVAKWVRLSYNQGGSEFNAVFVLPQKGSTLLEVADFLFGAHSESHLSLPTRYESMRSLGIPKFKASYNTELSSLLKSLGVKTAFNNGADFTAMSTTKPLTISAVVHKACIEVNEVGTIAAAATAVRMLAGCAMPPPERKEFIADQPFFYLIEHAPTGAIVFIGKAYDPSAIS